MDSLFDNVSNMKNFEPLAMRMRPQSLDELYGQEKVVGKGTFLRAMLDQDTVPSLLLHGPAGTGKTTLATIVARHTRSHYVALNATNTGVPELRKVAEEAKKRIQVLQQRTILFLDEIHRFNKAQQDVLLPYVEDGTIILVGATTENPYFEVNRPLLSRLRLIALSALTPEAIAKILEGALTNESRGLGLKKVQAEEGVFLSIGRFVNGDARMALNLLEQAVAILPVEGTLSLDVLEKVLGQRIHTYDKKGNNHYDTISAFIKSMRGSDPHAVVHYLARMIESGEDPNFIARRIVICAAEDVGLADPQALVVANAAAEAARFVGFPEARIILSEAALYVALAPKSNSAYLAIDEALADVRSEVIGNVPNHLRDRRSSGGGMEEDSGNYLYPHDYPKGWVQQQYLPDSLVSRIYYEPVLRGTEEHLVTDWQERRKK